MIRKWKCAVGAALVAACLTVCVPQAKALQASQAPDTFYLTQNYRGTCTLCSATMMIRASMHLNGNADWVTVTENSLRPDAWVEGTGMWWNFTHRVGDTRIRVSRQSTSGITASQLKSVLDAHPEGIVLYCGKLPHAVYLTGYSGDVFYCADTVAGYSGVQLPLDRSYLGDCYGSQAAVLSNVTGYWYVADYTVDGQSQKCGCSDAGAGVYEAEESLKIYAGHGENYQVVGTVPAGSQVTVLKGNGEWVHILYNDTYGFVHADHLKQFGRVGKVTTNDLRIRSGAGTNYTVVGFFYAGQRVQILETKQVGSMLWGRTAKGWISLSYVKLDPVAPSQQQSQMGTVTGYDLRIRSGAGTGYAVLGLYQKGDRVQILETEQVGSMLWGRTAKGWISMSYVKLDEPEAEKPQTPAAPAVQTGTVNTEALRIRAGAGTNYYMIGCYYAGQKVQILETAQVGNTTWGRTDLGWISLDYVK